MQEGSYKNVNKAIKDDTAETMIHDGPCWLEGIVINANGTTCVMTIRDGTTDIIAGTLAATPLPHFCHIGANIETSLKIEFSFGAGAAGNVLIIYKK